MNTINKSIKQASSVLWFLNKANNAHANFIYIKKQRKAWIKSKSESFGGIGKANEAQKAATIEENEKGRTCQPDSRSEAIAEERGERKRERDLWEDNVCVCERERVRGSGCRVALRCARLWCVYKWEERKRPQNQTSEDRL